MPATTELIFDKQEQVDKIVKEGHLLDGEPLYAVLDMKGGGTGFIALTDRRVIYYDKSFMGNHKALVSIPYHQVSSVGSTDEGGIMQRKTSTLILNFGSQTRIFEFRGQEKAHDAYRILMREILQSEPR